MSLNTLQEVASVGPEVGIHGLMAHANFDFFYFLIRPSTAFSLMPTHVLPK